MNETPALNQGQHAAAQGFFDFLFNDEKELIISGPGGVGKTFLMGHMIDKILPDYFKTCDVMGIEPIYREVAMTATTNKAAEVLGLAANRPTSTVHSLLNLKVMDDYSTGKSKISKKATWYVHEGKIIFIDESSMIDTDLLRTIREGTTKCKIVYVGDHCQLAPIFEPISPIYAQSLPFFELTEQMRTNIPELQAVNSQLRQTVETGEFQPIKIVPGIIDYLDDSQMQDALINTFTDPNHDSRILAYTNKRVMAYNDFVREIRNLPEEYQIGETLINNSSIQLKARMLSVEEEVTINAQSSVIENIEIEPGVYLKVRNTELKTEFGEIINNVLLPVDRAHHTALIKYYSKERDWKRMYDLKNKYPDLRQRDSSTFHKAQGSTRDSVFIDLRDLSACNNPNQAARMLYVAFSRARYRVFLYGELASKYGGLIR